MVVISWVDIFGFFGLELECAKFVFNFIKGQRYGRYTKLVFINLVIAFMPFEAKVAYYYVGQYIIKYVQSYFMIRRMNKEYAKLGLSETSPWAILKLQILAQIRTMLNLNPYKKLWIML